MGVEDSVVVPLLLFVMGALAGFVDSIVGGGGLISMPALLLTNLPLGTVLGTNKFSSVFGSVSAVISYSRGGKVQWPLVRKLIAFTFVGSVLGTILVISLPPVFVKPLIIFLLFMVLLVVIFKKEWGKGGQVTKLEGTKLLGAMGFALALGFYDGFIGPGTGMFLIFSFLFLGFDFLFASGNSKVLNATSNIGSLLVFLYLGQVHFLYGLLMGAGQMVGALLGSKLAMLKGARLVRIVFITVTVTLLTKLTYDYIVARGL